MPDPHSDSLAFETLARELLNKGLSLRFEAHGASMSPVIRDREVVYVTPVIVSKLRKGAIVLTKGHSGFRVHRLVFVDHHENVFITRGDCGQQDDPPVRADQILGIVLAKEVRLGKKIVRANLETIGGKLLQGAARAQRIAQKILRKRSNSLSGVLGLVVLLAATSSRAQTAVVVDTNPSTSTTTDLIGPGTKNFTFTHTTSTTANRELLVSLSMNIANSPTAAVTGITYNGTALTLVGAHNDTANTRRAELWSLLNPASGTNLTISVTVNIPATATVGVVAGATTFTDVDQTVPLGAFASGDGPVSGCVATNVPVNSQCNSQTNVTSVVNGLVFDTVAVGESAVTVNGPQVQQWNATSGGTTSNATLDVTGAASTRAGAPSVPISESFNEVLTLASAVPNAAAFNLTSVAPNTITLALTSVNNKFGGNTVYNGVITGGGANAYVGDTVVVAGFTNGNNNGTFTCTASSTTTITLNNTNGVAQTHAATAVVTTGAIYTGTITGGAANAFSGDSVVVTGFTNAGNNGTFTASASTATTLTVNNKAPVAETDPGAATVSNGAAGNVVYTGTITGGTSNGFAGDSFIIAGFTNAGNNGTFTCTASTATTLTCPNTGGVAETNVGTATTNNTFNWSLGAVSLNPSVADIAVTTSVQSAVFLGQTTTYTITVTNNGTSAANAVKLVDTLATGMMLGTVTATSGTTCTGTGPITCTLPTPFASGATATITVPETATAAGSFANSAVVSDSNIPIDPNTANNTYVAVATVQSVACNTASQAAPGTNLTGTLNTYYPGTASVAAGAKSIPVGTPTGAGAPIANGSLLLVIQMQDASINDSNSVAYGNGYTGEGFTQLNSAGNYEFVTATAAVSAGAVPIAGAGSSGGLVSAYHASAWSATAGQSTYQVIVVPQYTTVSFNATTPPTALAWNGSTGGVLVIDASSTVTMNGAVVSVDGMGFRGGAGLQLSGGTGANSDYLHAAPAAYAGALVAGTDAPKGEGISGTPLWVESGTSYLQTNTGYPSGTTNVDGSSARGAPGNGGGGGTDGDPAANDQNAGGGGGGNGGIGGFGGDSWNSNFSDGGEGGGAFPATINRIAMGGGGGAGTRNNSDGDNQASGGATGGGIIILRANLISGTGTLSANGAAAYIGTANDAGGGAGAGGSIVLLSATGGESGVTMLASGGRGGDAWDAEPYSLGNRHGPGGGGAGGVVFSSGTPALVTLTGGANGTTLNPGVSYGATSGGNGIQGTATITQTSGTLSGAQCTPDVTLAKTGSTSFTRGQTGTYTIAVENVSPYGPTNSTVTVNDTLPVGLTPITAAGTGWTCSIVSQTVSCIDSSALAGGNTFYPSITVTANVLQTAPATETNTAYVSGGGEINLTNDSSTYGPIPVTSTADLSLTNTASPVPVAAGANATFTQVLTNNGPSAADNASLVQAIPANTTFVSMSAPTGWSCITPAVGGTGNVVCSDLSMVGGTAATFALVTKVSASGANGTVITDTATASSSVTDPNSLNNTASASTVIGTASQAEMVVTNAASPNPVVAGNNITYTQISTNVGSVSATNPTLTETTPTNTTFVSLTSPPGTTCTTPAVGATGTISCTAPAAPAGSSGTVVLVVKVGAGTAAGTVIADTVTVNATNQSLGANSATTNVVVASAATQADVALSTVATPLSVYPGNDISYVQTVTNNGPATATGVTLTEPIPTGTTFVSVSAPAGWSCTTTGTVVCTTASMASGTSADIIVIVNVPAASTATSITATSTVSTTTTDPYSANNSTSITTPVVAVCDLAVTNSGTPSPVTAGSNITYTQVVTNTGPSNCGTATFAEPTPANTTFVSVAVVNSAGATWVCPNTAPVACTDTSVVPNSSATITAIYTVSATAGAGTIITDTATVASATHDTNQLNNSATVMIGVAGATQADLSVTNSASPNPVNAGSNITYTQTVTNAGPAAASTVVFTETLPANTTAVSLTGPAGWTCTLATLKCTISTLAASTTTPNFTFVVTVNNTVAAGTTITQSDSVSSATGDPNSGNNTVSTTVYVAGSADMSLTNTDTPVPVQAGNNITYTQVVTNAGPSTATTATLTETTPANTNFQSITIPAGWSCTTPAVGSAGTITCTNPSFAAGSSSFTIALQVTAGTPAGTAINNPATVSSAITDPNPANNTATAADVVALSTQADLVTTNVASPTSVSPGSNVTYTQSVTNSGPAAATAPTFTQTTPPNTNFQSITAPTGWTCTAPALGATGTITCTDGTSLALNATANFTLVLQVNSTTTSGTSIAETATASATNIVPNLTNNSATATVIVANANSADVAIVKTATPPSTVPSGHTLVYTLVVTNNGPATATNVIVMDPLPTDVTYLSSSATNPGTCSEAGGTVTCTFSSMNNAATATISILTLAGSPGTATNTATVRADQTDSNPANNTSTQTEIITAATSIKLMSFTAQRSADKTGAPRVILQWRTGGEAHNLGFNIYRDQDGSRVPMNKSLIAGSALLLNGALPKHSGKTYAWIDSSPEVGSSSYWLEDMDTNGTRTLHGPISPASASIAPATENLAATPALLTDLNRTNASAQSKEGSHPVENAGRGIVPTLAQHNKQFEIAAHAAVKISVRHEGWYRVTQPDLLAAGLDANVDPTLLHLYAEAIEQPMQITGTTSGPGGFGPQAAINFYGTGIDTQYTGTKTYFLTAEDVPGQRIQLLPPSSGSNQPPASFPYNVELTPHTTYFSALTTSNGNNFFGPLVSSTPVNETLQVSRLDATSTEVPRLQVILQGVILALPHDVTIVLNGTNLGDLTFTGQAKGKFQVDIPQGLLQEGTNTVTLTSQDGEYDYSLVHGTSVSSIRTPTLPTRTN